MFEEGTMKKKPLSESRDCILPDFRIYKRLRALFHETLICSISKYHHICTYIFGEFNGRTSGYNIVFSVIHSGLSESEIVFCQIANFERCMKFLLVPLLFEDF